jgi:hypothetical protein
MKHASGMANRLHLESGGRFAGEAYSGGVLDRLRITNRFDQFQRRTNLVLINAKGTVLASTNCGHDPASRSGTVAKSGNTVAYFCLPPPAHRAGCLQARDNAANDR